MKLAHTSLHARWTCVSRLKTSVTMHNQVTLQLLPQIYRWFQIWMPIDIRCPLLVSCWASVVGGGTASKQNNTSAQRGRCCVGSPICAPGNRFKISCKKFGIINVSINKRVHNDEIDFDCFRLCYNYSTLLTHIQRA